MAVTSRSLHQAPSRRMTVPVTVTVPQWKPRLVPVGPYARFGAWLIFVALCAAVLSGSAQTWIDDVRYGRPRTHQISGMVGHNEASGEPTHFVAMNLNRRVLVIEIPGGDVAKAQTLEGPYLFGADEDLTAVRLDLLDANSDGKNDLVLSVKREKIIYINEGENFRLINAEERQQLSQVP